MKNISDRGESKGLMTVVMITGLYLGLFAVFAHISYVQNNWLGSW